MMDESIIESLVKTVHDQLEADPNNFDAAVIVAEAFCSENLIEPQLLVELSSTAGPQSANSFAYVFSKVASRTQNKGIVLISLYNAGLALQLMGRFDDAENEYQAALSIDPKHLNTHYNYGLLLKQMGRFDDSEKEYQTALSIDFNDSDTHYNYGNLLKQMGRLGDSEKEYKIALSIDSKHLNTHLNYGILLQEMDRFDDSEKEYKTALSIDSNDLNTHLNYGNLLQKMGRFDDSEKEYKIALSIDPNDSDTHCNYGLLLHELGRFDDSEKEYQTALSIDSKHSIAHYNYGNFLKQMGRFDDAENEYQAALSIDPNDAYAHGAYGIFLLHINNLRKSMVETKIASGLFKEQGDKIMEHLALAWIYELIAAKHYSKGVNRKSKKWSISGNFRKSGQYADISGNEYILAGKNAEGKAKTLYLTKGYTLKGRADIRKLDFSRVERLKIKLQEKLHPHSFVELRLITSGIHEAAENYKKVAEISESKNSSCSACCICMTILNETLDCVHATTMQKKVPDLNGKVEKWNKELDSVKSIYANSKTGTKFVEALRQMISSISCFEDFKTKGRLEFERNLDTCIHELKAISDNIEGPLQDVIDRSAQQMKKCAMKRNLYVEATEAPPLLEKKPSRILNGLKWAQENIVALAIAIIAGLLVIIISAHYGLSS